MKHPLVIFLSLLLICKGFAQHVPTVTLEDKSNLRLHTLKVGASLSGNYASVTYDMTFYNSLDRVLEGELAFPLAQGQSVSQFAMDLNGTLRYAVVVEKELGRVAYENTIRQQIDPALLEQTKGNNYKARVYPIPANGYKRIVVTYEQNLIANNGSYNFNLPLDFKSRLETFEIDIRYSGKMILPKIESGFGKDLEFRKNQNGAIASYKGKIARVDKTINISIPIDNAISASTEDEYFHLNKVFQPKNRPKEKPNSVTILWDASYSMLYKNLDDEIDLLDTYFKYLKTVKVNLVVFSNTVIKTETIRIKNSNWDRLKNQLKRVNYDGGTSLKNLPISKSDEILLFSDGMHNLGNLEFTGKSKLYCINSVKSSNHDLLETLATKYGGNYINLNVCDNRTAVNLLKNESFQFLGINSSDTMFEIYPRQNTTVNQNFTLSGKFLEKATFELLFGYGNEVTERISVDLNLSSASKVTKRLWAKSKLKHLLRNKDENKEKIVAHSKMYHLISPYTSMIVLDRIEDYVRYKIEPPKELLQEYKRLLSQRKSSEMQRNQDLADRMEELKADYKEIIEWHKKDFKIEPIKKKRTGNRETSRTAHDTDGENTNTGAQNIADTALESTKNLISGTVISSSDGQPLPGVNVVVKGTVRGAQTDFDGNFSINARPHETLVFSFVGMTSKEASIGTNTTVNVVLDEDISALEEVVITGYAASQKSSPKASISVVSVESITPILSQTLSGEVAGINIVTASGQPGGNTVTLKRGLASLKANSNPLFVVDGVPTKADAIKNISREEMESITILKDVAATAIYGSRGANGVVVIVTKKGLENKTEKIEALNVKIQEQTTLQPWDKNASYIELFESQKSLDLAYDLYLKIRSKYRTTPSFFLDVAEFFESRGNEDYALRIATNLIEIEIDNHELIRALGYKLDQYRNYDLAVYVYEDVLKLRPEEPQSYRDLALAHKANGNPKEALRLLSKIVKGELLHKDEDEMYYGIEQIAFVEWCNLTNSNKKQKSFKNHYDSIDTDIRIVVDWNHAETDLDLYLKNPAGDMIYYGNPRSIYGGRMSEDMTDGYGPESFLIKKAQKGSYEIAVDYYSDRVQKITGPTCVKVTIFRNYGRSNEEKDIVVLRLSDNDSKRVVGTIEF